MAATMSEHIAAASWTTGNAAMDSPAAIPPGEPRLMGTPDNMQNTGASPADGMLREWNFSLHFAHQNARVLLRYGPQWVSQHVDLNRLTAADRQDSGNAMHPTITPFLKYIDSTASMKTKEEEEEWAEVAKTITLSYVVLPAGKQPPISPSSVSTPGQPKRSNPSRASGGENGVASNYTLAMFCKQCVQHILKDTRVKSVDGQTNLRQLQLGRKLHSPHTLAGQPTFAFRYTLVDKAELLNDEGYALGVIINRRGYLITVTCPLQTGRLDEYLQYVFLPHYLNKSKFSVDRDVEYNEVVYAPLREQQELFGELRYHDRDAAVSFAVPMHPMRIRPDFSPTQTVGVGSIACMTLEIDVYQRLVDVNSEAEVLGMQTYKVNHVILFLDVESVSRMNYPRIMSIEDYSRHKVHRLLEIFGDAKVIGLPISLNISTRTGRSRTVTFTYEPMMTVVKAMLVSTLINDTGITALFLTKLGGGLFDAHLYLYQYLLHSISFHDKNVASLTKVSRYSTVNVRLTEQDLARAYSSAPTGPRPTMTAHLKALKESNDGKVEGGVLIQVDPVSDGGVRKLSEKPTVSVEEAGNLFPYGVQCADEIPAAGVDCSCSEEFNNFMIPIRFPGDDDHGEGSYRSLRHDRAALGAGARGPLDDESVSGESITSFDASRISVGDILHLANEASWTEAIGSAAARTLEGDSGLPEYAMVRETSTVSANRDTCAATRRNSRTTVDTDGPGAWGTTNLQTADERTMDGATITRPASEVSFQAQNAPHGDAKGDEADGLVDGAGVTRSVSNASAFGQADRGSVLTSAASTGTKGFLRINTSDSPVAHPPGSKGCSRPGGSPRMPSTSGERSRRPSGSSFPASSSQATAAATPTAEDRNVAEINEALKGGDADMYFSPSLHDVYLRCCDLQLCRPNSYLLKKLPRNARFTSNIEEIDVSSNYLGRNGFVALLHLLEHIPRLRAVIFNDMSLDNTDVENMCEVLERLPTVQTVSLCKNNRITLPATRLLTRLIRTNRSITSLSLEGTSIGVALQEKLQADAMRNGTQGALDKAE